MPQSHKAEQDAQAMSLVLSRTQWLRARCNDHQACARKDRMLSMQHTRSLTTLRNSLRKHDMHGASSTPPVTRKRQRRGVYCHDCTHLLARFGFELLDYGEPAKVPLADPLAGQYKSTASLANPSRRPDTTAAGLNALEQPPRK